MLNDHKEKVYWLVIGILILSGAFYIGRDTSNISTSREVLQAYDVDDEKYTWKMEDVATNLDVPWDMVFDQANRLYFTERSGKVKMRDTDGSVKTLIELSQVASAGESGLTGIALHPKFDENKKLYIYYSTRKQGSLINRISRYTLADFILKDEEIIIDDLPGGSIHNGGRLRFGPDGKLWIPTGDAGRPGLAQDKDSLGGKILRVNDDGSPAEDNPIKGSRIFSIGHRNPQGMAWHPLTEELLVTEHGETAHDEINKIEAGKNYGWPAIKKCTSRDEQYTSPVLCSGQETYAPSGIEFMGSKIWRFRTSFVFAGLRGNRLERVEFVDGKIAEREILVKGTYGRIRGVAVDSQGNIYFSTSNKDGRGEPKAGDDRIVKATPQLQK